LRDNAGNEAALRVDLGEVSPAGHDSEWFTFSLARGTVQPVYLRVRLTTPLADGDGVYIDEIAIAGGTELYTGGPYVAAFSGNQAVALGDSWTMAVANSRAGEFQTWFDRVFGMAEKGLILTTRGVTLIPDTLIG
jgi:hypothetical protein